MGMKDRFRADRDFIDGVLNDARRHGGCPERRRRGPVCLSGEFCPAGRRAVHPYRVHRKENDLIRKNPRVGFSAYVDVRIIREKATTTFRSVCGTGTAAIVEDKEEKRTALDAITVRYKSLCPRPAPDSMINRVAIIRIDIDSLMGKYAPGEEEALKA